MKFRRFYDEGDGGSTSSDSPPKEPEGGGQNSLEAELSAAIDEADTGADPADPAPELADQADPQPSDDVQGNETAFLEQIRNATGVDFSQKYESDEAAYKAFVESQKALSQRDEEAQMWRQIAPHWQQFQQWQSGQVSQSQQDPQQPPQNGAGDGQSQSWWNVPEFDPTWEKYYDSESGEFQPNAPPEAIQWQSRHNQWRNDLMFHPDRAFQPMIESVRDQVLNEVAEYMMMQQTEQQQTGQIQSIYQKREADLFQKTPDGQPVVDPQGNPVPTVGGAAYNKAWQEYSNSGLSPEQLDNIAWNAFQLAVGGTAPPEPDPDPNVPGTYQPPPAAAAPGNATPGDQQPGDTLYDQLMRVASAR